MFSLIFIAGGGRETDWLPFVCTPPAWELVYALTGMEPAIFRCKEGRSEQLGHTGQECQLFILNVSSTFSSLVVETNG